LKHTVSLSQTHTQSQASSLQKKADHIRLVRNRHSRHKPTLQKILFAHKGQKPNEMGEVNFIKNTIEIVITTFNNLEIIFALLSFFFFFFSFFILFLFYLPTYGFVLIL